MADSGTLLVLQTYNIAFDTSVFASERHRVNLSGCYTFLLCTGARPAEIVDNDKKKPKDGSYEELFGPKGICYRDREGVLPQEAVACNRSKISVQDGECGTSKGNDDKEAAQDEDSGLLEELLCQETRGRGRPKALCYEDVLLMVVRHLVTGEDVLAMSIKLVYYKGADNKPKP